jgi:signal transduction histidine kinase
MRIVRRGLGARRNGSGSIGMGARAGRREGARAGAVLAWLAAASPALAEGAREAAMAPQAAAAALIVGMGLFSALAGVAVMRARRREKAVRREAADEVAALQERLARAEALNRFDDQVVLVWDDPAAPPRSMFGRIAGLAGIPQDVAAMLAFENWLAPESASGFKRLVEGLQRRGEGFSTILRTRAGDHLEAEGRCAGASVLLRFHDISAERAELARIADRHAVLMRDVDALRALLAEVPHPVWVRDGEGRLAWANAAYARAVGASDAASAVTAGREFLEDAAREEAARALAEGVVWRRRIAAGPGASRRAFDVIAAPVARGAAGIAVDVSDAEAVRRDLERLAAAHQRTLDGLPTPVVIYGADQRLVYFNPAWRELWGLDLAFLAERPTEGAVLDALRFQRKLPEQRDYPGWKAEHLAAHRAAETRRATWHLPDGRTVRSEIQPHPQGGVTIIQEDVSEVIGLRSRSNAYERTQRETLDALSDAVAVFGSDARLKLSNPAFFRMWPVADGQRAPHVDAIFGACRAAHDDPAFWASLKQAVIALGEDRRPFAARIDRRDGAVIDVGAAPLPDGATLVTFVDVTASVNVERALQDKNEALMAADRLKNAFVQHVSYELRSPLTNIIGFAQLLSDPSIGPLDGKQREYMGYIMSSSSSLLAIINDILDLATIDAGVMQLDLTRVDVRETMEAAAEGVRDRLADEGVALEIAAAPDVGAFVADAKRVRQTLYNLLSNAVGFSEKGQTVRFSARRDEAGRVVFAVADEGRGIGADVLAQVFDRFESYTSGSRHRGAGLGLSIVKSFVELHGGSVSIDSELGRGTVVTCVFPPVARERPAASAAA